MRVCWEEATASGTWAQLVPQVPLLVCCDIVACILFGVPRYLRSRDPAGEKQDVDAVDPTVVARREAVSSGKLVLSDRSLASIPDPILSDSALWASVTSVDLTKNAFVTLPPALSQFRRLEALHVDLNQLQQFAPSLATIPLVTLSAARNQLTAPGVDRSVLFSLFVCCVCHVAVGGFVVAS